MSKGKFSKNVLIRYLACSRLLPNYIKFSREFSFGDPNVLEAYISYLKKVFCNLQQQSILTKPKHAL